MVVVMTLCLCNVIQTEIITKTPRGYSTKLLYIESKIFKVRQLHVLKTIIALHDSWLYATNNLN